MNDSTWNVIRHKGFERYSNGVLFFLAVVTGHMDILLMEEILHQLIW